MEMEFLVLFPNRKHGRKLKVCKGKLVHDEAKLELYEFKFNQLNILFMASHNFKRKYIPLSNI